MTKRLRSFPPDMLDALRALSLAETLQRLGLFWKRDPTFKPDKSQDTERLYIDSDSGHIIELVVTWPKWYDTHAKKGGGGAIDLAMHLCDLPFVEAVKRLRL